MGLDMYLYEKQVHEVAYWRKANAIHGWIINTTNAIDDCTPIELRKQDLYNLREACIKVLSNHSVETAMDLLPPTSGFFFGSDVVDDGYWADVQETLDKLNDIIDQSIEDAVFEYQASW